jgi:PKD repeat protein
MKWDAVAKGNGLQATNLCAGNYSVEIKDNLNGCVLPMDFTLNQPSQLTVNLGDDRVLCSGQSVLIQPIINKKEVAYNWTSANGFSGTTAQVNLDKAGEYQLEITDTKGCKALDTIRITTSNQLLDATFLVASQTYKDQEIVLINVSNQAGQTYEWILPETATAVSEISKSKIIKFSKIGVYSVGLKVKNEAGCTTTSTKQLLVEEDPKLPDLNPKTSSFIKEFLVYPNPTINNGLFSVKVSLSESVPISLTLYEQSNGSLLNQTDLPTSKEHLKEYQISLSSGIYLIILRTSKGVQSKKIIVN